MKDTLVIYHANCPDGFTGAWLLWRALGDEADYVPDNYGGPNPHIGSVRDRNVFIVDFSYPRKIMENLASWSRSIQVWDHHKTAEENCRGLDFCTFDMDRCGSRLLFETYIRDNHPSIYSHDKARYFVRYVDDNDRWVKAMPNTDEVRAAYLSTPFEFPKWGALVASGYDAWVRIGRQILDYQNLSISQYTSMITRRCLKGHNCRVPIVNLTFKHITSSLLGELAKHAPFAVAFGFDGKRWVFSLRSREGGMDVSEIARGFGGGGHRYAAGFQVKSLSDAVEL